MGSVPLAFSVHRFISSVGSDAGFASIIGLAILVLLYFAQARETATLRDQAEEASGRVAHLEGRLAQLSRVQAPAASAPAPAPGSVTAGLAAAPRPAPAPAGAIAAAAIGIPAAPMGVGAPALSAATRLIPSGPVGSPAPPAAPARATPAMPANRPATPSAPVGAPVPVGASAAAQEVPVLASRPKPADATAVVAPPPATVAGAANGGGASEPTSPPPASPSPPPPPRIQIRPGAGAAAAARRPSAVPRSVMQDDGRGRRVGRSFAFLAVALTLAAVAAVALLLILTSGGGANRAASVPVRTSNAPGPAPARPKHPAAFSNASVTVAVLNGTATGGVAHKVAARLAAAGFKEGTVGNSADQTRTATIVAYLPGHRRDALAVATVLKLGPASVQAIDQPSQAVACPPPAACTATAVVTVGNDLASIP